MKKITNTIYKHKLWILIYAIAFFIRVAISLPLIHDWDGFVFSESAKNMMQGITPYQTVESNNPSIYPDSDRPMTEQWYGYPPLPLIMFTIQYAMLVYTGVHITPFLQNFAIKIPFILGDIWGFLAGLCWGIQLIISRKLGDSYPTQLGLFLIHVLAVFFLLWLTLTNLFLWRDAPAGIKICSARFK